MSSEPYWMYQSAFTTPGFKDLPEGVFSGSESEWLSLTPGMRREIVRSHERDVAKQRAAQADKPETLR